MLAVVIMKRILAARIGCPYFFASLAQISRLGSHKRLSEKDVDSDVKGMTQVVSIN